MRQSGDALDLAVAEVLGLTYAGAYRDGPLVSYKDSPYSTMVCPRFSRDLAEAWKLVRHVERLGFHWRIQTPFQPGEPYFAGFTPHGVTGWNGRPDFQGSGPTPEIAICDAFLNWSEAPKPC